MATKKCMQCGGSTKKMAKGGSTTNKLNNARGYAKPQTGGSNTEKQIYGVPNVGPTGNNLTGTYSYKKGGLVKKMSKGGSLKPVPSDKSNSLGKLPTAVRNKMGFQKKGGAIKKLQDGGTGMSKLEQKLRKAAGYTISDNSSGPMNSTVAQKTKKNGTTKFVATTNIPGGESSRQTSKTNKAKGIDNYKYVAKDKNGKVIDKTVDNIKNGQETAKKGIYFSKGGMVKKGGAVKNAKFAALAPPYNKATFADKIVGAKRNAKKK